MFVSQLYSLEVKVLSYVFSLLRTSLGNLNGSDNLPLRFFSALQIPWLSIITYRNALNLNTEPRNLHCRVW
jgi:hypothetical protein